MRSIKITKSMIHLQKNLVSMIISDNLDFHV